MVIAIVSALTLLPTPASAEPDWAGVDRATIRPGAVLVTGSSQCTANFVFVDGERVFIGQAAHCASADTGTTNPDGCTTPALPIGTPVGIEGAAHPGTLVYSSWAAMQAAGETDPNACAFNDFALVELHPEDGARVNPSFPHWGGPTGSTNQVARGATVLGYGKSPLILGLEELQPRQGISRGRGGDGWFHLILMVAPGVPGDSGSGMITGSGEAFGVVSTLVLLPEPLTNGVTDLTRALDYMRLVDPTLFGVHLATGTEPFTGGDPVREPLLALLHPILSLVESLLYPLPL